MQGGRGAERVRVLGRPLTAPFFRSEYNAFWKCVQAGVTYLFVQLCKVRDSGTPRVWPPGIPDLRDPDLLLLRSLGQPSRQSLGTVPEYLRRGGSPAESLVQLFLSTFGKTEETP